tara:strand:- start:488 stop:997 length:510 start_codon:yes stop_codon:yes gene_type:complete
MLNDAGCDDVRYPPQRLSDLLITGAYFLPLDINFSTTFVVDVEARTITPNPIDQTDGDEFINFMVLRAACMADEGNFRTAALAQGISARLGPASLQTSNYGQYLHMLLKEGPCRTYERLVEIYNVSYEGSKVIRAVLSPFASNNYDPSNQLGSLGAGSQAQGGNYPTYP